MPKISIIFPVYNTETYLVQAVESVLNQTYGNWEILAIDDGSTDGSLDILREYKKKDPRIKVFEFKNNTKLGYVRNFGLTKAQGQYIIFLDSDDFLAPEALELLNDNILKKPKTDVFVWGFKTCKATGKLLKTHTPVKPNTKAGETPFSLGLLCRKGFQPVAWVYAVKRKLIEKHDIKFAEGIYFEDIIFSTKILFHAKKVGIIKYACYYYRKHVASITSKSSKQKIDDKFTAHVQVKSFLREQGVLFQFQSLYMARFLVLCVNTSFHEYFVLPMAGRDNELDAYMYKIRKSKLFRKENLLLLYNIGASIPKKEKGARKAYLGGYHGLKAVKTHYHAHRFIVRIIMKINNKLKRSN